MRVGLDGRALASTTRSGVEIYVVNLARALAQVEQKPKTKVYLDRQIPDPELASTLRAGGMDTAVLRAPRGWLQLALPWRLWRDRVDVVHLPSTIIPVLLPCPAVVTVHDLAARHYPEMYSPRDLQMQVRALLLATSRAAHIIAVSESTARDLTALAGVSPDRISVIPLGVSSAFSPEGPGLPADAFPGASRLLHGCILHTGGLHPRKNVDRLLEAYASLRAEMPLPPLAIAGDPEAQWGRPLACRAQSLGIEGDVVFTGVLSEDSLAQAYRTAKLVVYPSLYEGFGLPILEAMASGVPVVAANRSSMPEVAGDAAILVDPESAEQIAEGLRKGLTDERLREELVARGLTRSRHYSWALTARDTVAVYERVAQS